MPEATASRARPTATRVGNFYLVNGRAAEARAVFEQVTKDEQWAAFGYIAAEADLVRLKKSGS